MGVAAADLSAIPIHPLSARHLSLGPFGSGRDLVKFLAFAAIGATIAAITSAAAWLPFLAAGALVAFVRVDGQTLDDYALGYCRFRWRASVGTRRVSGAPGQDRRPSGSSPGTSPALRAGGIPIAYLPSGELQRLFDEWRSTLAALDRPIGCRMRGEVFSILPFLPKPSGAQPAERGPLSSYRELVRTLLRHRYRRVVDLTVWNDPADDGPTARGARTQLDELVTALERLGIPVRTVSSVAPHPSSTTGACR
jgi:hypothetical protein